MKQAQTNQPPREKSNRSALVAWAFYDWASNAFATVIITFVFSAYFIREVAEDQAIGTTQWGVALGVAGILVAVGAPVLGATIDQQGRRKPALAGFTFLCTLAMASMWFVGPSPDYFWLAILLIAVAEITSEYAGVLYNAMLPSLAPKDRLGRWSGWGWTMGYLGGLLCLVIALLVFVYERTALFDLDREAAHHVRATFPMAALWFLLFTVPLLLFTPDTPSIGKRLGEAVRDGVSQLKQTISQVRSHANIVRFLIARIIFIDGLATLFAFGGIYATGVFEMDETEVLVFGIALNISAGIGAFGFAWVDDWIGGKLTIILALAGLIVSCSIILVVQSLALFWIFGVILGIFVGPAQAASRSLMSRIAPQQLRNEMFGFYAFSGKVAFICPLLVAAVTYLTASQRAGMSMIVVFFLVGLLIMLTVREAKPSGERRSANGQG